MIYLQLFLSFLKIGAVSFGGGYAMIAIIRETVTSYGWMTDAEVMDFVAVAESTPGPIAVNMATFVGSSQGGFPGALLATLGVVLPAFLIILLIASLVRGLLRYAGVAAALSGIRPAVVGLILGTGVTLVMSAVFSCGTLASAAAPDPRHVGIFFCIVLVGTLYGNIRKKRLSPIALILLSAALGVISYSVF